MGVVWVLSEIGPTTFRGLLEACETISPAVLNQRLKELRIAGLVTREDGGYAVTPIGRSIYKQLVPLTDLATDWAKHLPDEQD